jgi:hypothetical protein
MLDLERELKEALERKAGEVAAAPGIPRRMLRRAWRRAALTVAAGVVAATVLAAGAAVGVRQLGGLPRPADRPAPTSRPPTPTPTPPPPCPASALRAVLSLDGAAGSVLGSIEVENVGDAPCLLRGRPHIAILGSGGTRLAVEQVPTQPWWRVDRSGRPEGWPVVILRPGDTARIRVRWSNWCGGGRAVRWRIDLPDRAGSVLASGTWAPGCAGPGQRSTVEVGPLEPAGP